MFRVDLSGWYFTSDGELRACIVTSVDGRLGVVDALTLAPVNVRPDEVMIERPEP